MSSRTRFYKLALAVLHHSRMHRLLRHRFRGVGALLTLHHVEPACDEYRFAPNRILTVTPEYLDDTIQQIRGMGYDIVSLDELRRRLLEGDFRKPFVSFTLDDGYADNYTHAFPIFRKHRVPFAIYLCLGILDRTVDLWWSTLEGVVRRQDRIEITLDGTERSFATDSIRRKYAAFDAIYWSLRGMPLEEQLLTMRTLRERYAGDGGGSTAAEPLSWDMVADMQKSGLLTVGAHTLNHYALNKLSVTDVRREMELSREQIEDRTGSRPEHFAYPYGDAISAARREFEMAKNLGFATAVSTRKGVLFPEHAAHMHALPRISLNGDYQQARNIELFLSGVPFALQRGLRRLDVN